MLKTFNYLKNRFMEASTWAGIGVAFAAAAAVNPKFALGSVVCGALAVLMPDYSPNDPK